METKNRKGGAKRENGKEEREEKSEKGNSERETQKKEITDEKQGVTENHGM
ncbi:hypothetical protein ZOD2009_06429 [Haladaptatus paucihalophilus DX253]|uniref:Uncharacterized protein n=1 Tax=Haladaptatus paucihalophilus DX253 TaxID=797209 RepID=E7QR63_HALPU|nr:hypothetical protein [Haladaptatus paucihalophilus]EFW92971.1 hypothetical protein ZOD2009_06429 [Haladaptatus paucihalophilus DX253]